jgi:neuropeptide S receptor 1
MNFSGSWRRAKGLVIVAWILSGLFSIPILHFYNTTETEDYGTQCWIHFSEPWQWQLYMTLVSVTLFVIPAILIAGCYIIIVCTIWNKGREMQTTAAAANSRCEYFFGRMQQR